MSLRKINIFYLIVLLLFATVGAIAQGWNLMYGLIITEVGLVLIPSLVFLFINNIKPAEFIRFKRLRLYLIPYVIGLTISGWFIAEFIGILSAFLLSRFIHMPTQPIPPPQTGNELAMELVIVAGLAAVCEETLMRGVILRGYEAKGETYGIIMSGFLFALLHLNPANFFSIWFLGIVLAYLVYRTDSIFSGMIAHFTNNSLALIIMYLVTVMSGNAPLPAESGQAVITPDVLLAWTVIVIPFIILFLFLIRGFNRHTDSIERTKPDYGPAEGGISDYWPVAAAAVIYIVHSAIFI